MTLTSTDEFVKNKKQIRENYKTYASQKNPNLIDNSTTFSDGIFLTNNDLGLDFITIIKDINLIENVYRKRLEEWFSKKDIKSKPIIQAQIYVTAILKVREFLIDTEYLNGKIDMPYVESNYIEISKAKEGSKKVMEQIENKVFTEQKDFTLSTIRELYMDGEIITNPDYQRDYVYDTKQASRLVESIIMGIPIPAVYLSQEDDGSYTVIDGQQRITSLVNYMNNNYSLTGLTELAELNNKKYKELEKPLQSKLKTSTLRSVCLLKESKELKYEIFARLNQGAVSLKPQELRNCIYRGAFNNMLDDIANNNKYLIKLFHDENRRKVYQERILRFFALRNFTEYKSSILKTMNSYMSQHQNDNEDDIQNMKLLYNGTIDIIKQVLGNDAFYTYDRNKKQYIAKFSGSVYDSIIIPFSFYSKHDLIKSADKIRTAINKIKETDEQYQEDTYAATGSKKRVIGRIMTIYNLLSTITGSYGNDGGDRLFSTSVKNDLYYNGYLCSYCKNEILSIDDCEVDHIIPFSQGGKTDISNAQLLHRHCNRVKNDYLDDEFEETDSE